MVYIPPPPPSVGDQPDAADLNAHIRDNLTALAADVYGAGTVIAYAGSTAPAGWLLCDGSSKSAATYPRLFAVIGTTWGSDGAGTFRVPDLVGRSPFGAGDYARIGFTSDVRSWDGHQHTPFDTTRTFLHGLRGAHGHGSPGTSSSPSPNAAHTHVGSTGGGVSGFSSVHYHAQAGSSWFALSEHSHGDPANDFVSSAATPSAFPWVAMHWIIRAD